MAGNRKVLVETTGERAMKTVAELLSTIACDAVSQRGRFTLALAGGTTPQPLYAYLARPMEAEKVPWQQTFIFFGDERDVPQDHADSNYRMVEDTLLGSVPVPFENVFPIPGDATNLVQAADHYAETIIDNVPAGPEGTPTFDLILLGMGGDGHTASLFPGTPALEEGEKLVCAQHVPVLNRWRVTFTLPLINAARHVILFITGLDKADAASRVLGEDDQENPLPAQRVCPAGDLYYVLDAPAASRTPHKPPKE